MNRISKMICALVLLIPLSAIAGSETVQEQRHELMEDAKDAAKPIAMMLKGEMAFDAETAMASFKTWADVAAKAGELFPEGSETGYDTRATMAVWTEREEFDEIMAAFESASNDAIAANPQDVDGLKAAAGPVFKTCKSCHETYRKEDEG